MVYAVATNVDPTQVTNALLAPFTVIGSVTGFVAGLHAAWELAFGSGDADDVQAAINFGIARGFIGAALPAVAALVGALASL
jgi:hypothetical protein